jgi:hypothetical protein
MGIMLSVYLRLRKESQKCPLDNQDPRT